MNSLTVPVAVSAFAYALLFGASPAAPPASPPGQVFRDCPECPEMVVVPPGSFLMGSSETETAKNLREAPWAPFGTVSDALKAQNPQHSVVIAKPFALGKYPVTVAEFAAFVQETGYAPEAGCIFHYGNRYRFNSDGGWQNPGFPQTGRDPVVCIIGQDAQAYIKWLNTKISAERSAGKRSFYRLPSEAEWEYAARAGTQTTRWWGDDIGSGNANCRGCGPNWVKQTVPVGQFRPNPFGLYDLFASVWQWTDDYWNENYIGAPQDGSAWVYGYWEKRVGRGGSWGNEPWSLTSASRTGFPATKPTNYIGFRVAKKID